MFIGFGRVYLFPSRVFLTSKINDMKKITITALLCFISMYQIEAQSPYWSLAGNNLDIYNSHSGTEGFVGVGTSSPTSSLTVSGTGNSVLHLLRIIPPASLIEVDNNSTTLISGFPFGTITTPYVANSLIVKRNWYQGLPFPMATYTDFIVTSAGKVGIGTATPANPLDVVGNATISGNVGIGTTSPSAKLDVRGNALVSGNVGIGTTSPVNPLDVVGNAKVSGITSTSGLALSNFTNYAGWANQIKFENSSGVIRHLIFDDNSGTSSATNGDLVIIPGYYGNANNILRIDGVVQIGSEQSGSGLPSAQFTNYQLSVYGQIVCQEMVVQTSSWSDTVFSNTYQLKPLNEVENYIGQNHHLPDVPDECDVMENGISLGAMNKILLQKVEELTLYTINLQKEVTDLKLKIK
jgi:hypothetical protein